MNASVHSFDVFDTTLMRLVGSPTSLFYFVGHCVVRLGWALSVEQFVNSRVEAEARARRNASSQEVTLDGIYLELAHAHDLGIDAVNRFLATELALEREFLRPLPLIVETLTAYRLTGGRPLFISDTYLPASTVSEWLTSLGGALGGERIWVSSEVGLTKQTGDLFKHVLNAEGVTSAQLLHTGDNAYSDGAMARRLGIRTEEFKQSQLTEHERRIESQSVATAGIASLLSGASRYVRLNFAARSEPQRVMRSIAAEVAGP